jgi:hypothetical protein
MLSIPVISSMAVCTGRTLTSRCYEQITMALHLLRMAPALLRPFDLPLSPHGEGAGGEVAPAPQLPQTLPTQSSRLRLAVILKIGRAVRNSRWCTASWLADGACAGAAPAQRWLLSGTPRTPPLGLRRLCALYCCHFIAEVWPHGPWEIHSRIAGLDAASGLAARH